MVNKKRNKSASSLGALGGKARAARLSEAERQAIAAKASAARWRDHTKVLEAEHVGPLNIAGMTFNCAVLEDGTRVVAQRDFQIGLGQKPGGYGSRRGPTKGEGELPPFLIAENLSPFISDELGEKLKRRIPFRTSRRRGGGQLALGIDATLIADICWVWVSAKSAGVLREIQMPMAAKAEALAKALSGVAIIALVDEATGFQYQRERNALAEILEAFIAKELAAWVKVFPDEFYSELRRLRGEGWDLDKRPSYIGHLTNNIVYKRLAPGVLDELKSKNPRVGKNRRVKHHQWLTRDIGDPKLREHLIKVTAYMQASRSWEDFEETLDKHVPKFDTSPPAPASDSDDGDVDGV